MFFGVNIGPVQHRLGIKTERNRGENRSLEQRSRARSKYGIPFASRWKAEIQNLSREISWQDLKDFCFNKSGVRPSRADINKENRSGTLCCTTERELRSVVLKLNGAHLKGRELKAIDVSTKDSESGPDVRRQSDRRDGRPPHRSSRHKSDHRKGHQSEHKKDDKAAASKKHYPDEPKIIIHQANGDRVITEKIHENPDYNPIDDAPHSDNEQAYFKRDRRNSRGDEDHGRRQSGREKGAHAELRTDRKKRNIISKYGLPQKTKWRIRIENLSPKVSWQDLKDLIRPYAEVKYADAHKPIRGEGNVHVSTEEGLRIVIKKFNNRDLKGTVSRFIDDSLGNEDLVESVKAGRTRSRSPHRKRRSRSVGDDSVRRPKSK